VLADVRLCGLFHMIADSAGRCNNKWPVSCDCQHSVGRCNSKWCLLHLVASTVLADVIVSGLFHMIANTVLADIIVSGVYCASTVLAVTVDTTSNYLIKLLLG
jgi:hypothetical protein